MLFISHPFPGLVSRAAQITTSSSVMARNIKTEFVCCWEQCGKVSWSAASSKPGSNFSVNHFSQRFNRKSDLERHQRIHRNERPYHCTVEGCNRRFVQSSALKTHNRTHTGERPYLCLFDSCDKTFSDVSNQKDGALPSEVVSKGLFNSFQASSFARHRRIHTARKPYTCAGTDCNRR